MGFKENLALFFKPDLRRIVLVIVIGILYYYFWFLLTLVIDCRSCVVIDVSGASSILYGYPLPFSTNFSSMISEQHSVLYSILFFVIDAYIWYLIACEVIFAYDIWKKKIFVKKTSEESSEPTQESSEPSEQPSEPQLQA